MRLRLPRKIAALLEWARYVAILAITEFVIIVGLFLAGSLGLLDYGLIASLVVVEVPLAVLFYYLFGEHRRAGLREAMDRLELVSKYAHLTLHYYHFIRIVYLYLENTRTKKAYLAPDYVWELGKWDLIRKVKHKNEDGMLDDFRERGVQLEERDPSPDELIS